MSLAMVMVKVKVMAALAALVRVFEERVKLWFTVWMNWIFELQPLLQKINEKVTVVQSVQLIAVLVVLSAAAAQDIETEVKAVAEHIP
jgi:hypothetical protein